MIVKIQNKLTDDKHMYLHLIPPCANHREAKAILK